MDVRDYDLEVLRDNVAMVLQKNTLFSGTIKENLRWGNPTATDEELFTPADLPVPMTSAALSPTAPIPSLGRAA